MFSQKTSPKNKDFPSQTNLLIFGKERTSAQKRQGIPNLQKQRKKIRFSDGLDIYIYTSVYKILLGRVLRRVPRRCLAVGLTVKWVFRRVS